MKTDKLIKIIFFFTSYALAQENQLPELNEYSIFSSSTDFLSEFLKLRNYFMSPKEQPVEYSNILKEFKSDELLPEVTLAMHKEEEKYSKALRRLFKYNCIVNQFQIKDIRIINSEETDFASDIDSFFQKRIYDSFLLDRIQDKVIKTPKIDTDIPILLKNTLNTFRYLNRTMARMSKEKKRTTLISFKALITEFFRNLDNSYFKVSEIAKKEDEANPNPTADPKQQAADEKVKENLIELISNLNKALASYTPESKTKESIINKIDELRTEMVKVLSNFSNDDNKLSIETYHNKLAIMFILISRLDIIKLEINDFGMADLKEIVDPFQNNIKATLLLSFFNFSSEPALKNFLEDDREISGYKKLKDKLIKHIKKDTVFSNKTSIIENLNDLVFAKNCVELSKKIVPPKFQNFVGNTLYNYFIGSIFNPPANVIPKNLHLGIEKEEFDNEKRFGIDFLDNMEDSFSTDEDYVDVEEMKKIGYRKQYYYLTCYVELLEKLKKEYKNRNAREKMPISLNVLEDKTKNMFIKLQGLMSFILNPDDDTEQPTNQDSKNLIDEVTRLTESLETLIKEPPKPFTNFYYLKLISLLNLNNKVPRPLSIEQIVFKMNEKPIFYEAIKFLLRNSFYIFIAIFALDIFLVILAIHMKIVKLPVNTEPKSPPRRKFIRSTKK